MDLSLLLNHDRQQMANSEVDDVSMLEEDLVNNTVNIAFLDKSIDWPSPTGTQGSRALALWHPNFNDGLSPSPTISTIDTPRPVTARPLLLNSVVGRWLPGSQAALSSWTANMQDVHTLALTTPVYYPRADSAIARITPLEQAMFGMRESVYVHRDYLDENIACDWLFCQELLDYWDAWAILLKGGQDIEATVYYNLALAKVTSLLETSASLQIIQSVLLLEVQLECDAIQRLLLIYFSELDRDEVKPSLFGVVARVLLQPPTADHSIRIQLWQCLLDCTFILLGERSPALAATRANFCYYLHEVSEFSHAHRLQLQLQTQVTTWSGQWFTSQRVVLFDLADIFFHARDYNTAKAWYDQALVSLDAIGPSLRHTVAMCVFYSAECNYHLQLYDLARHQARMVLSMLEDAPPTFRVLSKDDVHLLLHEVDLEQAGSMARS